MPETVTYIDRHHWRRTWEYVEFSFRPVAQRIIDRRLRIRDEPPTEEEKHDAILLLREPIYDSVGDEAFRILDEYGQ